MKKSALALVFAMLLFCLSGCDSSSLPEKPEDFSFSLTWNTYGISSYDSETGKLVKTDDATNPDEYITTYMLSEEELKTIYDMIRELDVESYPDIYDPHEGVASVPSMTIILSVHTSDFDKTITAENVAHGYTADNKKGRKFLSTVENIKDILEATDEWKALPDYEIYYE